MGSKYKILLYGAWIVFCMACHPYLTIGASVIVAIALLYTLVRCASGRDRETDAETLAKVTLESAAIIACAAVIWHFDIDLLRTLTGH